MAYDTITEKDAAAVDRKIATTIVETDKHVPAATIHVNGALAATANPVPVGGTLLTSLETILTAIQTAAEALADTVGGTELQADIVSGTVTMSGSVAMGVPSGATKKQVQKNYTTAQTGTDVWTPASGKRIAVKWGYISWSGANACRITIWQGANADTTFSEGTDPWLFDITLLADAAGGAIFDIPDGYPWESTTADHELHITISANKTVSLSLIGDERT